MPDAELEKLRGQFYVLAQAVIDVGEHRQGRRTKHNSALDTDGGQAYDRGGRE